MNRMATTAAKLALSPMVRRNFEGFIVVWLENHTNTEDNQETLDQLRSVVNSLQLYNDADECVDFITDVSDEKIFLLVSGSFGPYVIPSIHSLLQLTAIYVFCSDREREKMWTQPFYKIRGVYTDIKFICEQLRLDTWRSSYDLLGINVITAIPSDATTTTERAVDIEHRQEPTFMYAQLLKEILISFEQTEQSKFEMLEFWRTMYTDNKSQLRIIDEFEKDYRRVRAIEWYEVFRKTMSYRNVCQFFVHMVCLRRN